MKLLNQDIPNIAKELKRIADVLQPTVEYATESPVGVEFDALKNFEKITDDEFKEIKSDQDAFNEMFEAMVKTFELKLHFPNDYQFETIRNMAKHAYYANK